MSPPFVPTSKGLDEIKKPSSYWVSTLIVSKQLGISQRTVRRWCIDGKIASREIHKDGKKSYECQITPARIQGLSTADLVNQWRTAMRNGWLVGKPLTEKTINTHNYGLRLFYKNRNYDYEELSLEVLNPAEMELALANIPHDIANRNDHYSMKEKMFLGVLSFHKFLAKKGLAKEDVAGFRKIKPKARYKRVKQKIFTQQLEIELETIQNERFKLIAKAFAYTGLRLTEMVRLQVGDIDFNERTIFVKHGKGCKERQVGILPEAMPILETLTNGVTHPCQPVLRGVLDGRELTNEAVQKLFSRCSKSLNIHISPHRMRHTFASLLNEKGFSVPEIQLALGHANIETTMRYLGVNEQRLIARMRGY